MTKMFADSSYMRTLLFGVSKCHNYNILLQWLYKNDQICDLNMQHDVRLNVGLGKFSASYLQ